MPETIIATVIGFAFMLIALAFGQRYSRIKTDLTALRLSIRALTRREPIPSRMVFKSSEVTELWNSVLALSNSSKITESDKPAYDAVLSLGSRIVEAAHELSTTAEEVVNVVLEQTAPDVTAVALVLRNPENRQLSVEYIHGLPGLRIQESLLMLFDCLLDEANEPSSWGYQLPGLVTNSSESAGVNNSANDFSSFGVGLTLCVPLKDENGLFGGLWLGFKQGSGTLTTQRKSFVQAVAEHAAASLSTAYKVRAQSEKTDKERDFLIGVSHDLRAPGNSALFAVRDLMSGALGPLSEEQNSRLELVERSLEDQLSVIGDVLDYSKHQKGFLEARKERSKLSLGISDTLDTWKLAAESRGLKFESESIPETFINVDSRQFRRILSNILSNAIKYTEKGSISVSFKVSGGFMELSVADTGIGVPEAERSKLFQEFSRLGNTGSIQGVGLGLALARVLATLNDGYVFYEPNPAGGSIFGVGVELASQIEQQVPDAAQKLGTVVVADDDRAACRLNIRYLKDVADSLVPASSLTETLELIRDLKPDLLVTDLNLGDGSALTILNEFKAKELKIPVLIITGSGNSKELEKDFGSLRVSVIEKPVDRQTLTNAVGALLEPSKAGEAVIATNLEHSKLVANAN